MFSTHNRADQKKNRLIYEVNSMLLNIQVDCCRKIKSIVVCILFNLLQDCMLELWRLLLCWTVWFPYTVHSTLKYYSNLKLKLIMVYLVEQILNCNLKYFVKSILLWLKLSEKSQAGHRTPTHPVLPHQVQCLHFTD